jgi:alkanesulfonate monooxygenase SsuD/methylene tetrahydromethanopterin reductase-like flavin-dependent oxidoreductase (luciferase family)
MNASSASGRPAHPWVEEGRRRIRFGIFGGPGADWPAALEWVQMIEELGFDSYWVGDHPVEFPFDCFTRLAAVATGTKKVRLGTLVACAQYRHPLLLARQVADVDRLSAGRAVLGLGIGDAPREFERLGLRYGKANERQEFLEELLRVLPGLWGEEPVTFQGEHVRLTKAKVSPGPVQRPRVPIMVAGGGERVTMRQVARYADASNFGPGNRTGDVWAPDDARRKYGALRRHCEAIGRPYDSILRTHVNFMLELKETGAASLVRDRAAAFDFDFDRFVGTSADAVEYYRALADAGVRYFIVSVRGTKTLRLLAEKVVPEAVRE